MTHQTRRLLAVLAGVCVTLITAVLAIRGGFALLGVLRTGTATEVGGDAAYRQFGDVYTNLSWAALALAAGISAVVMLWNPRPSEKRRWVAYWAFLLALLPISLANYLTGDFYVPRWQQFFMDLLLVVLAGGAVTLLARAKVSDVVAQAAQAVAFFLLCMQGVAIPLIYAVLWLLNWQNGISLAATKNLSPGWVSAVAALGSLAVSILTYRRTGRVPPQSVIIQAR